jgi:DNA-binding transcriptional regulator YiaG
MTQSNRYHYTECGLDNVYLINGFDYVESPRGKGVVIRNRDGLDRAIGRHLIRDKKNLNGKEFRFLRHQLDMTQQLVANLLHVDVQAIARYEKGKTVPIPGPAQGMIRVLYNAKAGGHQEITRLLEELAELDELINGDDETLEFEETAEGWQTSDLVAA